MKCPQCGWKPGSGDEPWRSKKRDWALLIGGTWAVQLLVLCLGYPWLVAALCGLAVIVPIAVVAVLLDDAAERRWRRACAHDQRNQ